MRITAKIYGNLERGDSLDIRAIGRAETDPADCGPFRDIQIAIPNIAHNRKTYHVGREIVVEVKPR